MFETVGIYVVALTILSNLIISFVVLRKDFRSATHRILALLSFFLASWTLFNFLALSPGDENTRLFYVRTVMAMTTPFGPLVYLLARVFPEKSLNMKKGPFLLLIGANVLSMVLAYSPWMFTNLKNLEDGSFSLTPGPAIILFGILLMGFLTLGIVTLIKKFRQSSGVARSQLKIFLIGLAISFTLMTLTNFIAVVVFRSIQLTFLGPPSTLIMISFIAYAIARHNLFNIKVLATELFSILIILILFSKLFVVQSTNELIVDGFIFLSMIVFSYLLIRSVLKEVEQRRKLEDLTKQLQELDQRKDEFLNIAAHELRAPMTAIKGYLSMIMEGDAGAIPDQVKEFLTEAATSNDRLIRLVNNMLNTARIEENRQVYTMGVVKLSDVTETVFNEFKNDATTKKLEYKLEKNVQIDNVYVDPDRIHEVIGNFISNSIKYTDKGSIIVKLSNPTPESIRFDVIDTGPGIPKESQARLFEKFYRVENENLKRAPGTGLGLYISKLLVEKFSGKIGFVSEVGRGSNFWFELPITKEVAKPIIMV